MARYLYVLPLILTCCFNFACQDKAATAELEKFRAAERTERTNEAVFRQLHQALDSKDVDRFIKFFAPGAVSHGATPSEDVTAENAAQFLQPFFRAFPDLTHHIEDIFSKGDRVVARILIEGTHQAELMGVPATGIRVKYYQISMAQIVDGKVREGWRITDSLGLMAQLGLELKPKGSEKK